MAGFRTHPLVAGMLPPAVVEVGASYEENALLKGLAYARWSGVPVMVDDTGLEVDALAGLPGVYTARFGVERVREQLKPLGASSAAFVCCIALVWPSGRHITVRGSCRGSFVSDLQQQDAVPNRELPFSSFFVPSGRSGSLSEIMRLEPRFLSHRGIAATTLWRVAGYISD